MKTFEKGTPFFNSFTAYYNVMKKYVRKQLSERDEIWSQLEYECSLIKASCPDSCIPFMDAMQNSLREELRRRVNANAKPDPVVKGSLYYEMIGDYVILIKKYIDGDSRGRYPDSDEFWEQLATDVDQFYNVHKCVYAKDLALNFLMEMDSRYHTQIALCA